jgi:hypothetical protein
LAVRIALRSPIIIERGSTAALLAGAYSVHAVVAFEIGFCIRDELSIGWVVYRFDADDFWHQRVIVLLNVFEKLELRGGWPDDEDLITALQGVRYFVKESLVLLGVIFDAFRASGMLVDMVGRENYVFVDLVWVNLEDVGFFVVDPDGDVFVHGARYSCINRAATSACAPVTLPREAEGGRGRPREGARLSVRLKNRGLVPDSSAGPSKPWLTIKNGRQPLAAPGHQVDPGNER